MPKTVLRIHHKQGWWSMAEIFLPLFSLTGIFFGLILSFIAPEELSPGRKYFIFLRRSLFVLAVLLILFMFHKQLYLISAFLVLSAVLLVLDVTIKKHFVSFLPYLLFLPVFFLNTKPPFHLVLATLIFLYGFPLGTLLRVKDEEQKQS